MRLALFLAGWLAACGGSEAPAPPPTNLDELVSNAGSPEGKVALLAEARRLHDDGPVGQAVAAYEAFLRLDPEHPAANAFYGSSLTKMATVAKNDVERTEWVRKGFQQLDDTVARFPDDAEVHLIRGINAVHIPVMFERYGTAIRDFELLESWHSAGKLDASLMPMVLYHHAVALDQAGRPDDATALRTRLAEQYPSSDLVGRPFVP